MVISVVVGGCVGTGPHVGPGERGAPTGERVFSDAAEPCPGCALVISPISVIGDRDHNALDGPVLGQALNRAGHVCVLALTNLRSVTEFDRSGRLVQQIGRTGDGPGEFRRASGLLVGAGDSVFTVHQAGTSVFGPDGVFARQYRGHQGLQRPIRVEAGYAVRPIQRPILLESGDIVNLANPGGPAGNPIIHVYGESAGEARSFGPVTVDGLREGTAVSPPHVHAPSRGDAFWIAPRAPYRLERWNRQGSIELVLERSAAHHPATDYQVRYDEGRVVATYPFLSAIAEDSEGRVWTAVVDQVSGRPEDPPNDAPRFESVLEVLDPTDGRLLGTARVPGIVRTISPHGHIVSSSVGDSGIQRLMVFHGEVRQP